MPPTWADFSWELVREERDNVKEISVIIIIMGFFGFSYPA
jgi:hypothetical protein